MGSNFVPSFDDATSVMEKQRLQGLWDHFQHNFEVVRRKKGPIIKYPNLRFKQQGIPSPRQYIAWEKLIQKIGEDNFLKISTIKDVSLYKQEIILEKIPNILEPNDELDITIVCGSFWEKKDKCRERVMNLLTDNIQKGKWRLTVHTQDRSLKKELKKIYLIDQKINKIYWVPYRIDIHYIIIINKTNPEKSFFFFEFPHTEEYYFRLFACISFNKLNTVDCTKEELFLFLENQPKRLHPKHLIRNFFVKSLPSFIDIAIK